MKAIKYIGLAVAVIILVAMMLDITADVTTTIMVPASALTSLQDSVTTLSSALKKSGEMIVTLRSSNDSLGHKIKLQAASIAELKIKLPEINGSGAALPSTGAWKTVVTDDLIAAYRINPDSLHYTLFSRPVYVTLVEDINNTWSVFAWDQKSKQAVPVDSIKIQRNVTWQPPKPWYKKLRLGGGLGYYAGFHLAGEVGFGKNIFISAVGIDDHYRPVYGGTYIREIGY